jgi:hypothetical protein
VPDGNKNVTFINTDISLAFNPILADGNYRATITGALTDTAGNAFAGHVLDFYVLAGDANRDRKVDFDDLVLLAQNYNTTGKNFGLGNFNYDPAGNVDFNDLVLLAQRYNTSLPSPAAAVTAAAAAAAPQLPASSTAAERRPTAKSVFNTLSPVQRKRPARPLARRA